MKKTLAIIVALVMVMMAFAMVVGTASAEKKEGKGGKAGHIDLDAVDADSDAWGKMNYVLDGTYTYVFNGKGLVAGETYELRSGGIAWGSATANNGGNVHIQDSSAATPGSHMNLWVLNPDGDPETDDDTRVLRGAW